MGGKEGVLLDTRLFRRSETKSFGGAVVLGGSLLPGLGRVGHRHPRCLGLRTTTGGRGLVVPEGVPRLSSPLETRGTQTPDTPSPPVESTLPARKDVGVGTRPVGEWVRNRFRGQGEVRE